LYTHATTYRAAFRELLRNFGDLGDKMHENRPKIINFIHPTG